MSSKGMCVRSPSYHSLICYGYGGTFERWVYWVRLCLLRMFPIVVNETWVPSSFCFLIALERAESCISCTGHGTWLLYRYKWTRTIECELKTKTICGISLIKVIHLQYLLQQHKTEGHHGFLLLLLLTEDYFHKSKT